MWNRTGKLFTCVLNNVLYAWMKMLTYCSFYPESLKSVCNMVYCCIFTFDMFFRGLAGRHVAQAQLMQSCLAVVKASMLVVQRSQEPISSAMLSASSDQSDLHQVLCGLLNCYTCILTDGIVKTTSYAIDHEVLFVFTIFAVVAYCIYVCIILKFLPFFPPSRGVSSDGPEHCWDGCCFVHKIYYGEWRWCTSYSKWAFLLPRSKSLALYLYYHYSVWINYLNLSCIWTHSWLCLKCVCRLLVSCSVQWMQATPSPSGWGWAVQVCMTAAGLQRWLCIWVMELWLCSAGEERLMVHRQRNCCCSYLKCSCL